MPSKSGVALVIVLGFLSVLVLIAVSFVISMRTERLAARAYVESIRAKFIVDAGFARMMSDLDDSLGDDPYPRFTTLSQAPDLLHSIDSAGDRTFDMFLQGGVLNTNIMRFSPRFLSLDERLVGWKYLYDPAPPTTNRLGRYAYLVVDCSGLLDVNTAGGSDRLFGTSPSEIQLENNLFQEFEPSTTNLPIARSNLWRRYESLPDFLALGRSNSIMTYHVLSSGTKFTSNFTVFSHAPAGWLDANGTERQPVFIGGVASQLIRSNIVSAFSLFTNVTVADQLADSLLDYVDDDFLPRQVDGICVEPTPLINEILIEQWWENGTNYCKPKVELWFPFVGITNPTNYIITLTLKFSGADPADYNPPGYTNFVLVPGPWPTPRFFIADFPPTKKSSTNLLVSFTNFSALVVTADVLEFRSRARVDRVTNVVIDLSFADNDGVRRTGGVAVVDPRLNHLPSHWAPVGASAGGSPRETLGEFNEGVANLANNELYATNIYIANRPLRNTGEIGMLFKGEPWKTISLLGPESWPVLHVFTVHTDSVYRGRININSANSNVLAAAFLGAPLEMWPGQSNFSVRANVRDALNIATQIMAKTTNSPLRNVGDLGQSFGSASFTGYEAWQSESILRNSGDLLTTRQQLFTAFIVGEALDQRGETTARRSAVALIWRDPIPNSIGRHDWFIRYWQWLDMAE